MGIQNQTWASSFTQTWTWWHGISGTLEPYKWKLTVWYLRRQLHGKDSYNWLHSCSSCIVYSYEEVPVLLYAVLCVTERMGFHFHYDFSVFSPLPTLLPSSYFLPQRPPRAYPSPAMSFHSASHCSKSAQQHHCLWPSSYLMLQPGSEFEKLFFQITTLEPPASMAIAEEIFPGI